MIRNPFPSLLALCLSAAQNPIRARLRVVAGFVALLTSVAHPAQADMVTEAWVRHYNGPTETDDQAQKSVVDASGNLIVVGNSYNRLTKLDWLVIKYSSAGAPMWTNRYDGGSTEYDFANAVAVDGSGNVFVTGSSRGYSTDYDYLTIKYSSAGVPVWTNRFNGPANSEDKASALALDASGNVFVTGDSFSGSSLDYLTLKYSSEGLLLWTRRYNGPGNVEDHARALAVDGSENVIVTGNSYGAGSSSDYATVAYSNDGVPLWTNRYNGPANTSDVANAVGVDGNGNVFVTGLSDASGLFSDYVTIAYSGTGVPLWTNRYDGPGISFDQANALAVDGSGNVFVTGASNDGSSSQVVTIAYSNSGVGLWTNTYSGPGGQDSGSSIAVDADGRVYVTGSSARTNTFPYNYDYTTVAYSSAGVPSWTNRYNGPGDANDSAIAAAVDGSGNVFVTGYSARNNVLPYNSDYATLKYSSEGVVLWTNRYEQPGNDVDSATAVVVDGGGNVFVTGYSYRNGGGYDYLTLKYSSEGLPLWTNRYDGGWGNLEDRPAAMALDGNGDVVVTGYSTGSSFSYDYVTIKYSGDGLPLWTNRYGIGSDYANAVAVDENSNVYVTGVSAWTSTNSAFLTIAYSRSGAELWAKTYNGPVGRDRAGSVAVDGRGNVYVTGSSDQSNRFPYNSDYATAAYSSAGELLWVNRYSGPGDTDDYASAVAVDSGGNVIVTGSSAGDYLTIAYSRAGVPLWTNVYNGPGNAGDTANAVAVDGRGNVFVTGTSIGNTGSSDYATIAYSGAGLPLWTNRYAYASPGNGYNEAKAVIVEVGGTVTVTGSSAGGFATLAYSNDGVPLWTNRYNGPANGFDSLEGRQSLASGPDGGVYVTGGSNGDFVTIKYAVAAPMLTIQVMPPDAIRICWPTNAAKYVLEFKDQLLTNVTWTPVSTPVGTEGGNLCTTNRTDSDTSRFYRLRLGQGL